jgi:L-fuconolactonase
MTAGCTQGDMNTSRGESRSIVDAHTHVWNRSRHPQHWIDPVAMAVIDRDFAIDDLTEALERHRDVVARAVIVQASNSTSETTDILTATQADRGGTGGRDADSDDTDSDDADSDDPDGGEPTVVAGVVGWVDLTEPDVASAVESLRRLPGGNTLVGIRHLAHMEQDPTWLTRPDVSRGLGELGRIGLSFDLVLHPWQLAIAHEVVRSHPETRFVLDHLGKPPIASGDLTDWERALRGLSTAPNVVAKLSGLTIEASWDSWTPQQLDRVLDIALSAFGPQRLMFGSDWPLVELAGGYRSWLDAYLAWTNALSTDEQRQIDALTASTTYGVS